MGVAVAGNVVRRIVERANLEEFADRLLGSFWDRPEFQQFHPPREAVRAWVRWNLDLVVRWLVERRPPSERELDTFREHARARAAAGIPADIIPANFRRGARFAWGALLEAATEEERPALLESAGLLLEYVDRVSAIYSEVYEEAARAAPASAEEVAARALLARICAEEPLLPEDHQLAEELGFALDRAAHPFVIAIAGRPSAHTALAAQLRRRGALAVSEGRRVAGLAHARSPWSPLNLGPDAVVAQARPAIRAERGRALEDLRMAVAAATSRGVTGEISVEDYLAELLLQRSPHVAAQIHHRVYGRLSDELAHTLDVLVEHSFGRGSATAAALPVHRNTLRDRIARISEATGLDLDCAEGRGLAWLAWLQRRGMDNSASF
jgi:hypothetical protein